MALKLTYDVFLVDDSDALQFIHFSCVFEMQLENHC